MGAIIVGVLVAVGVLVTAIVLVLGWIFNETITAIEDSDQL